MTTDPQNSIVKSLSTLIPGYKGYQELEYRRSQDREVRKLLAQRLSDCRAVLQDKMKSLKSTNDFKLLEIADRLHGEIDLAEQKTLAAYEGYSSWFANSSVDADKLKQVVELDESLISLTDRIRAAIPETISDLISLQELGEFTELYLRRFEKRRQILHG